MLGLPTETEDDMRGIAKLSNEIAKLYYELIPKSERKGRVQIVASSSFFVPKPFTPFQWAKMYKKNDFLDKAHFVNECMHEQLNSKSIKYNYHEADVSILEGVFARGDRKLSAVLIKAYENGCLFDAWTETFREEPWIRSFEECGISMDFYTSRERSLDEILPWDMIDIGVTKDFLKCEWNNALNETVTPNCRMRCSGCGARIFGGGVCYEG